MSKTMINFEDFKRRWLANGMSEIDGDFIAFREGCKYNEILDVYNKNGQLRNIPVMTLVIENPCTLQDYFIGVMAAYEKL